MKSEQNDKLILLLREASQVLHRSIDDLCEVAEKILTEFSETNGSPDNHVFRTEPKCLLTKEQLSKRLGICERLISSLINEGLPYISFETRKQFDYDDVVSWAKNRNVENRKSKTKLRVVK